MAAGPAILRATASGLAPGRRTTAIAWIAPGGPLTAGLAETGTTVVGVWTTVGELAAPRLGVSLAAGWPVAVADVATTGVGVSVDWASADVGDGEDATTAVVGVAGTVDGVEVPVATPEFAVAGTEHARRKRLPRIAINVIPSSRPKLVLIGISSGSLH